MTLRSIAPRARTAIDLLLIAAPWLLLEAARLLGDEPLTAAGVLARAGFVAAALGLARLGSRGSDRHRLAARGATALGAALAILWYLASGSTLGAWIAVGCGYAALPWASDALTGGKSLFAPLVSLAARAALALLWGLALGAAVQVESSFADEEFFVAMQALALAGFGLLLLAAWAALRGMPLPARDTPIAEGAENLRQVSQGGGSVSSAVSGRPRRRLAVALTLAALALAGAGGTLTAYQRSSYPSVAPTFPGITPDSPFLCGAVAPSALAYDGPDVHRRLLERTAATTPKGAAEYGLLAAGLRDPEWARRFHDAVLEEAGQGLFTGAANSVKSVQRYAALRAYYYARVREAFPDLFTEEEDGRVRAWFAAINRRALTVEWVDWAYALAFSRWPEGPYENQESGAGLLATLEVEGLADAGLEASNRDYLARNPRGWTERFRNTDDSLIYQPEWFGNAYLQGRYTGTVDERKLRLAAEWLLLQSLPDGALVNYNHPYAPTVAETAYLAARLLDEPRYLWLAGHILDGLERAGSNLYTQPGLERPYDGRSTPPAEGSCLLFGDSGLPTQVGPLAPDKIVFRDGWEADSTYLLLNLRFTGWHRYKATNTVTLLYQAGALTGDNLERRVISWLPEGRSLLRDKRVPRENLNGLLVERSGLGAVLHRLLEIDGPWAQDPPAYARVTRFETGAELDASSTVIDDWRGWRHQRDTSFYHGGPVAIVDEAEGPAGSRAALAWNLPSVESADGLRLLLRGGERPAELLLVPLDGGGAAHVALEPTGSGAQMIYNAPSAGRLHVATVFLTGPWAGAQADLVRDGAGAAIRLVKGERQILIAIPSAPRS